MANPIHLLALLMGAGTTLSAQTGQSPDRITSVSQIGRPADSIWKNKWYFGMVAGLSAGLQFSPPQGGIALTVPYTLTDASGGTVANVFSSPAKKVYHVARPEFFTLELEYGRKRYFSLVRVSYAMEGGSVAGYRLAIGGGLNWYLQRAHSAAGDRHDAGLLIQTGVSLVFNEDGGANRNAIVGGIADAGDTVHILGNTAGPNFTVPASRYSAAETYASEHVDIGYAQREMAIMPMISIMNHFMSEDKVPIRVDIGYSIPVRDDGFVVISQDDGGSPGKGHHAATGDQVRLGNPAVDATYNGIPVKKAPYRLKGIYVSVSLWLVGNGARGKKRKA